MDNYVLEAEPEQAEVPLPSSLQLAGIQLRERKSIAVLPLSNQERKMRRMNAFFDRWHS